jgi:acyl-CoA thioesterase
VPTLADDTALTVTDSGFQASLNPDWEIFGMCGGYLAAVALRAAGLFSGRARPASIMCAFLRGAKPGPIAVEARGIGKARRTETVGVRLVQNGRQVMEAMVTTTDDALDGPRHDAAPMPAADPPEELTALDDLVDFVRPFPGFRARAEERTLTWDFELRRRPLGEPRVLSWFRFRPESASENGAGAWDDPYVDAARTLLLIDTMQFTASGAAYPELPRFLAQSLDLVVHFHRFAPGVQWLLCEATAPVSEAGLLNGRSRVWSHDGALLASGGQQMLWRRL